MLRAQKDVEWTLFDVGWLADYFLLAGKSFMVPIKDKFPIDMDGWSACVRGHWGRSRELDCCKGRREGGDGAV